MSRILKSFLTSVTLLSALIIMQCGKPTSPQITINNQVIGQWQWESSIGGLTGWDRRTPEKDGYNIILSFKADSTYTRTRIDTTGSVNYEGSYYIATEVINLWHQNDTCDVLYIDGKMGPKVEIVGVKLSLLDICYDCFGHTYVRVK